MRVAMVILVALALAGCMDESAQPLAAEQADEPSDAGGTDEEQTDSGSGDQEQKTEGKNRSEPSAGTEEPVPAKPQARTLEESFTLGMTGWQNIPPGGANAAAEGNCVYMTVVGSDNVAGGALAATWDAENPTMENLRLRIYSPDRDYKVEYETSGASPLQLPFDAIKGGETWLALHSEGAAAMAQQSIRLDLRMEHNGDAPSFDTGPCWHPEG